MVEEEALAFIVSTPVKTGKSFSFVFRTTRNFLKCYPLTYFLCQSPSPCLFSIVKATFCRTLVWPTTKSTQTGPSCYSATTPTTTAGLHFCSPLPASTPMYTDMLEALACTVTLEEAESFLRRQRVRFSSFYS